MKKKNVNFVNKQVNFMKFAFFKLLNFLFKKKIIDSDKNTIKTAN